MKAPHTVLALSLLAAASVTAAPPAPTAFVAARGGNAIPPVAAESNVYLAAGSTLTAWDRNADGSLRYAGDTRSSPTKGQLNGLARQGDYLYASYRGHAEGVSGVAVYSIADRDHPQLLGQYPYAKGSLLYAGNIAVANGYLYVLDNEYGLFASNLTTNPAVPVFSQVYTGWSNYDHVVVDGNRLYTTGRNFLSSTPFHIFDLSTPLAPQLLGSATLDGYDNFRLKVQPPFAYGVGLALNVTDFSDPAAITQRGRIDAPVAYEGLVLGSHAWSMGLEGIDVWNITNPDAPAEAGHSNIDSFATIATKVLGDDAFIATMADRILRLDATQPATPTLRGEALLPGGAMTYDIAIRGDTALMLASAYGLGVAERADLAPIGRMVAGLEASIQGRAFEQLAVDGNRAYMTSWGSGLVIADISNPRAPVQSGYWEYPFATAIAAAGNYAYVGRSTNGGELVVLDVTDPAQPQPLASMETSKIMRLALHGNYLYVADEAQMGNTGAGLYILDVSKPAAPQLLSHFDGCGTSRDLALAPNGRRLLLSCGDRAQLLDVSNPAAPVLLGSYETDTYSVALHGDRAYIGGQYGRLDEVSFADPAQPQLLQHWDQATGVMRLQVGSDARVYAMTTIGGVYVYEPDQLFVDGME